MKLQDFLVAQSKVAIFFEALLLILITGYFDYVTTWELSLSILYAFPIFMVTWYGDRRSGILLAFVCGAAWYGANANTQPYITSGGYIAAALNRLTPDQREAVVLKVYEGFKFEEMAEILGCPVSTVKSRLYTALDLLKDTLTAGGKRSHELRKD